jgi:hypothetical protein
LRSCSIQGPAFHRGRGPLRVATLLRSLPLLLTAISLAGTLLRPGPVSAQEPEWNDPRVLQMIEDARILRQGTVQDSTLQSYSSQARGYVYFFLDREDTNERILVKSDQIAVEAYWKAPNLTKQIIVGLRDEESLPTNIHYHLDHLVVVQDEFGDRIRIGDGDEVEAVVHPAAPASEEFYDFLLVDSVTLSLQSSSDTIRVYEIQVRPRNFDAPGFVGSVFLDRASRAIVRMSFTFTPASYVDPYLDHIRISLENGLWLGRHWLPFKQQLEIRREVPYLDIPAGSIIRGWFEIRDYQINPPLPEGLFTGSPVSARSAEARQAFPFEEGLFAQLEEEGLDGLRPPPEMEEIRAMALSIAKDEYLSGLGGSRLFLPSPMVSSALRFNRAEGLFLGAGVSQGLHPSLALGVHAGFSFGRERPALLVRLTGGNRFPGSGVESFLSQSRDLGPLPGISGVLNTLNAVTRDKDHTDYFFASGVRAFHSWSPKEGWRLNLQGRQERHVAAMDVVSSNLEDPRFRPVIPTDDGNLTSVSLGVSRATSLSGLQTHGQGYLGWFNGHAFGSLSGGMTFRHRWLDRGLEVRGEGLGGALLGDPPLQGLYYLGGRGTVPGYAFRSRIGDRFWLLKGEGSLALFHPWVRLRALAAVGQVGGQGLALPGTEPPTENLPALFSGGLGLGLGWDVARLDLIRGFSASGRWELVLSVNPDFWAWL